MRILTRYLLKAHLGPFLFALSALTGILFVNTIARRFEEFAGKGLPASVILEVFALSLPHVLALTFPMAVLVAVLYAFAQLGAENEITALKASGTNLIRMIMPLVAAAFLFAGFMLWFNDRVLPETNHGLKNLMSDVAAKTPTLQLKEQVVNPIRTADYRSQYWLKAARIDDATRRMWDVVIYDLSEPRKSRTIYADSGRMAMNPEQTDLRLTLYDGIMHELDEAQPQELQRVAFTEQRVELKGVGTELRRSADEYRSDREMSSTLLRAQVDTARRELALVRTEAVQASLVNLERVLAGPAADAVAHELEIGRGPPTFARRGEVGEGTDPMVHRATLEARRLAGNARSAQDRINQYQVEVHKKYAIPFACIIFVLIGAPLALRFPRGGVGLVIAASFVIFAIYYMSLIGGEALGDRGVIEPFWGPWAPNLFFGILSLWALSRLGRETASSRGGGWDEVTAALGGAFSRFLPRRRRAAPPTGSATP